MFPFLVENAFAGFHGLVRLLELWLRTAEVVLQGKVYKINFKFNKGSKVGFLFPLFLKKQPVIREKRSDALETLTRSDDVQVNWNIFLARCTDAEPGGRGYGARATVISEPGKKTLILRYCWNWTWWHGCWTKLMDMNFNSRSANFKRKDCNLLP